MNKMIWIITTFELITCHNRIFFKDVIQTYDYIIQQVFLIRSYVSMNRLSEISAFKCQIKVWYEKVRKITLYFIHIWLQFFVHLVDTEKRWNEGKMCFDFRHILIAAAEVTWYENFCEANHKICFWWPSYIIIINLDTR